jgi:hypothetical protein
LIEQATVIVVATVAQGSQSGPSASVVLEVKRTLKGSGALGVLTAEITVSNEFAASRDLKGLRGLWFLSDAAGGPYRVLPAMVGSVPLEFAILPAMAELPPSWVAVPSATATERVLRELSAAVESKDKTTGVLSGEFLSQIPVEPASSLRELYRRMLTSPAPIVSLAGLAGLVRSGDVEGLVNLKSRLAQLTEGLPGSSLAQAVCEYFNGNSKGLALLAEFAGTAQPVPRLRECAAFRAAQHPLSGINPVLTPFAR